MKSNAPDAPDAPDHPTQTGSLNAVADRRTTTMTATLACLLSLLLAQPQPLDARADPLWRLHFPRYAQAGLPFEGGYVCVPAYDARFPSSRGISPAEAQRQLSITYEQTFGGGMSRTLTRKPDDAELDAFAATLPALQVGHYGRIAAVRVLQVIDDEQMIVKGIRLIDDDALGELIAAERRRLTGVDRTQLAAYLDWKFAHRLAAADRQRDRAFGEEVRLVGFPTAGLRTRQVYAGPQDKGLDVAVVKLENFGKKADQPDKQRLVLMPAERLKKIGLTETQFVELLAGRGLDPTSFVALVQDQHARHKDRAAAEREVFARLLSIERLPKPSP